MKYFNYIIIRLFFITSSAKELAILKSMRASKLYREDVIEAHHVSYSINRENGELELTRVALILHYFSNSAHHWIINSSFFPVYQSRPVFRVVPMSLFRFESPLSIVKPLICGITASRTKLSELRVFVGKLKGAVNTFPHFGLLSVPSCSRHAGIVGLGFVIGKS